MRVTLLIIGLLTFAGCSSPPTSVLQHRLKSMTLTDGVSEAEARIIAQAYFDQNVGCGAFTGIRDGGDRWIVDGKFGYAGTPITGFSIDKRSGKLTSPIGPSYDDPRKIYD
jgi:hypothetical protein